MNKLTKKKKYAGYNATAIRRIKQKYGLTVQFIYQSLKGERNSETSIKICEDYKIIVTELHNLLKTL